MNSQETATTITEIPPDSTLNLEQFFDDSFLEGEVVEKRPVTLAAHHSARGGAYMLQAASQCAAE